ncbi:MAG: hypothetical protein ACI9XO_000271 [Paraglaciecola sp.]
MEDELDSKFWKGDDLRFGTNGTEEGLFLLPNYELKKEWFPTNLPVEPSPFLALIENENKECVVEFKMRN